MQNVLVTGGAGFIGSHTVNLLLSKGLNVVVYDNLVSGQIKNLDLSHPKLKFIEADILDYPTLLQQVKQTDAVLHLAALSSVSQSIEEPLQSFRVNALGFIHVLQAIVTANRPIRCVYASSAAVYGSVTELPCSDERPLPVEILSPYALAKANNERYAELFVQLYKIKSLGLRYFNVYGANQNPHSPYAGVIAKFINQYQADKSIVIFGDGKQSRDFVHVLDVANANWLALQSDYHGVLNIATGVAETLTNLVSYIEHAGGKPAQVQFAASRLGDIRESYATVDNAKKELGFQYTVEFAQGLHALVRG